MKMYSKLELIMFFIKIIGYKVLNKNRYCRFNQLATQNFPKNQSPALSSLGKSDNKVHHEKMPKEMLNKNVQEACQ